MASEVRFPNSFRSFTRYEMLLSGEERAFVYAGDNVSQLKSAHNDFHMNQEIYRFAVNQAFTKNRMEVLRYLTSPEALDIDATTRLTQADVCELIALGDPTITKNLFAAKATAEAAARAATEGFNHQSQGS